MTDETSDVTVWSHFDNSHFDIYDLTTTDLFYWLKF